ncbi:hypothetical protein GALMADRAFT_142312 [Galerina marginata CBS 339.88]|uniref:Uncharacterized protein n=1 Tax=Galerina marginata (strain CBS 339.88) TaxID=685588 RepID=A0A067SQD7_GALM3|nr:hypothetical protein GALMADRAFT_142312 [Galerina marginata CBS 339.88]
MADPLSVTLAAISLATAMKDIVELAQKLERSFAKVARNFQNAQTLSAEVLKTVQQLQNFCKEHYEILNDSNDMKRALIDLIKDMKSVYDGCCELLPPMLGTNISKLKLTLGAWKNRNKVESNIRELKNRVNTCHMQFMMFAIMRVEKGVRELKTVDKRQRNRILEETANFHVHDERVITFIGSSSTALSKLPSNISVDIISDTYLRLQIDAIHQSLTELSSAYYFYNEEPLELYTVPFQPLLEPPFRIDDRNVFQQDVTRRTLEIQAVLRRNSSALSIQSGAWEMVGLSVAISYLGMLQEASTIGIWTVNLFRVLAETNSTIYSPYLVHALRHLTKFYIDIGNLDGAEDAVKECLPISRRLAISGRLELKTQLGGVLTTAAAISGLRGLNERSLIQVEEAVETFESIFSTGSNVGTVWTDPLEKENCDEGPALQQPSFHKANCDYARALHQLSHSLHGMGRIQEAAYALISASKVFQEVVSLYPGGQLEMELAATLTRLSQEVFRPVIPVDQAFSFSQLSVGICRRFYKQDPKRHVTSLCCALWENANILGEMGRFDEAQAEWNEISILTRELQENPLFYADALYQVSWSLRRLKRHDEAAVARTESVKVYQSILKATSEKAANGYHDLAIDLTLAGRHQDAIRAAQDAITQYRTLAFKDPDVFKKHLAKGLSSLTSILTSAVMYDQAFNEGHEALKLYESLLLKDPCNLSAYTDCLDINSNLSLVSDNEAKSVERCEDVIYRYQVLIMQYPADIPSSTLRRVITVYSYIFMKHKRLSEASHQIQAALELYDDTSVGDEEVEGYMTCLILYASILHHQGEAEQAVTPIGKAIEIGKCFPEHPSLASLTARAMYRLTHLYCELGREQEALQQSRSSISFARQHPLVDVDALTGCLEASAMAFQLNGQPEPALVSLNEALELCQSGSMKELASTNKYTLLHLPQCTQALSENLADVGKETESLICAQQAVNEALLLKSEHPALPWSEVEEIYMSAQFNLAVCLSANDDLPRALDLVAEVRSFLNETVQSKHGSFPALAAVLRAEGIFHCAMGEHKQGLATGEKLRQLQTRLDSAFPSVASLVEVELRRERQRASWITLFAKFNLQCGHQDEA